MHNNDPGATINAAELARLKSLDIVSFNGKAEVYFVAITTAYLQEEGPQPVGNITNEAAYLLDISVETAKRYLAKYTARSAPFKIDQDKMVHLRERKKTK